MFECSEDNCTKEMARVFAHINQDMGFKHIKCSIVCTNRTDYLHIPLDDPVISTLKGGFFELEGGDRDGSGSISAEEFHISV